MKTQISASHQDPTPAQAPPAPTTAPPMSAGLGNAARAEALPALLARATQGPGQPIPARTQMESAFGQDFGDVRLFTGTPAVAAALTDMNAVAAAFGRSILCMGTPEPAVLAHELAHVVQQGGCRGGGGGGAPQGYGGGASEARADAAADAVMRGLPVPDVGRAPSDRVHRLVRTHGGSFETTQYQAISANPAHANFCGADILLTFTPDASTQGATVGLVQTVRSETAEAGQPLQPAIAPGRTETERERRRRITVADPASPAYGTRIDQPASNNPLYAVEGPVSGEAPSLRSGTRDPLVDTEDRPVLHPSASVPIADINGHGQDGHRRGRDVQPATLLDMPRFQHQPGRRIRGTFETAALTLDGPQQGRYLGSIAWGYQVDEHGQSRLEPRSIRRVSEGDPSPTFQAAAAQWNAATLPGGQQTIDLPLPSAASSRTPP